MAKCQFSDLMTDMRGSQGGTTYSRCVGGGHIRKSKPIPSISTTIRQTFVRSALAIISGLWRSLTDLIRSQWATFAGNHPIVDVFGTPRIYPAFTSFIKLNFIRRDIGLPLLSIPDLVAVAPNAPGDQFELHGTLLGFDIHVNDSLAVPWTLDVWKYGPCSGGRMPTISDVRHLAYCDIITEGDDLHFECLDGTVTLYMRYVDRVTGLTSPYTRYAPVIAGTVS